MAFELYGTLAGNVSPMTGENVKPSYGCEEEAFFRKVVTPIYKTIAKEAERSKNGKEKDSSKKGQSKRSHWRNYDDLNEYFENWKGPKLLSGAEFHVGAHVTKFLRLPMIPTSSDRASTGPGSDKTNRYALLFGALDASVGCITPIDELTFHRLQTLQRKMVDAIRHMGGLNPRSFRQFQSNGKAHRPGPDNLTDCELLCHYEMLPLENQLEIAHQIGTTRDQILTNLNDLSLGTSFM